MSGRRQYQPKAWLRHPQTGELVTWEACQTLSGSWGYYRDEMTWKSPEMLIRMLVETVSLGGNFLLLERSDTTRGYLDSRLALGGIRPVDAGAQPVHLRLCTTMAEPSFQAPPGLPADPKRRREAAVCASVCLSLCLPGFHGLAGEGGLCSVPARRQ